MRSDKKLGEKIVPLYSYMSRSGNLKPDRLLVCYE